MLGSVTGLLIAASTVLVWKNYRGTPRYLTGAVVVLLTLSVLLGAAIVITEAPLLDGAMSVLIVSSHLLFSILVLTCLVFTYRYVSGAAMENDSSLFALLFSIVLLQIIIGIFVRYSGASLACYGFPLCNGEFFPSELNGLVILHLVHRLVTLAVLASVLGALIRAVRLGSGAGKLTFTLALVLVQILLGVIIVVKGMFLPVVVLHGATGFFLLGYLAYLSAPFFLKKIGGREAARSTI